MTLVCTWTKSIKLSKARVCKIRISRLEISQRKERDSKIILKLSSDL